MTKRNSTAGIGRRGLQSGGRSDFRPARAQAHAGRNPRARPAVVWHDSRSPAGDVAANPHITTAGHHAYVFAGKPPLAFARRAVRDRLAPFMAVDRLGADQRTALLQGGGADRGGEICACFGVSCNAVEAAIAGCAASLDAVGATNRAGTHCGACRPGIRLLLRAARLKTAA